MSQNIVFKSKFLKRNMITCKAIQSFCCEHNEYINKPYLMRNITTKWFCSQRYPLLLTKLLEDKNTSMTHNWACKSSFETRDYTSITMRLESHKSVLQLPYKLKGVLLFTLNYCKLQNMNLNVQIKILLYTWKLVKHLCKWIF